MPLDPKTLADLLQQSQQPQPIEGSSQPPLAQMLQSGQSAQPGQPQGPPHPDAPTPPSQQTDIQTPQPDSTKLLLKPSKDTTPPSFSDQMLQGAYAASNGPGMTIPTYKDDTSPARSILSNMFLGMGASLTGQKFQSIQERKYQRYLDNVKLQLEQQQRNQQLQIGMTNAAAKIIKDRTNLAFRNRVEDIKQESDVANRNVKIAQFESQTGMNWAKFNLEDERLQEYMRHNQAGEVQAKDNAGKVQNPNYEQALKEVGAKYGQAQLDPQDPQNYPGFLQQVSQRKAELDGQQARMKVQFAASKTQNVFIPNADGGYTMTQVGPGQSVPNNAVTAQGMNKLNTPTNQDLNTAHFAQTVQERLPEVFDEIDGIKNELGWSNGRANDFFVNKGGADNPRFAGLDQDLTFLSSGMVKVHFGRANQTMQDELKKNFSEAQSPADLKARILSADQWLSGYAKLDKQHPSTFQGTTKLLPTVSDKSDYDAIPIGSSYTYQGKTYKKGKK